jgi:hypothetical protein
MPDPFDEETNEQQDEPRKGNQDRAFERLTQERDQLRDQVSKLVEEVTAGKRASAFDELKIDRKYAALYQGEVDTEAIKSWASEYGFVGEAPTAPAAPEAGAPEAPPAEQATPAPVKVGEPPVVGGAPTYAGKITSREYQKLLLDGKTDEAQKAYNEGRVEILTGGKFTGNRTEE